VLETQSIRKKTTHFPGPDNQYFHILVC
jgi:hypothetical protein